MKRVLNTYLLMLLPALHAWAQTADTIHGLPQITIVAIQPKQNELQMMMDTVVMQFQSNGTLINLLQRNSTIYIRQYGSGTLATVNSLGFNASHNPIVWNALLMNNPMNGVQDVNLMPLWFIEPSNKIQDKYITTGTSASFQSNTSQQNLFQIFSSFNTSQNLSYGLKCKQQFGRISLSVAVTDNRHANKIKYFNTYEQEKSIITHAKARMSGITTTLNVKLNDYNKVEAAVWFVNANRLLPPGMLQLISRAVEWDRQLRAYVQWSYHKKHFKSIWQTAYNKDALIYHDSLISLYANNYSSVYQNQWQAEYDNGKAFLFPITIRHQYIRSNTDNYTGSISQQRLFFQVAPQVRFNKLKTSAQLFLSREIVKNFYSPLAQKLIVQTLVRNNIVLSQEFAQVFQLPTLNDLYWNPGGNQNLLPEQAKKLQSSFRYFNYKKLSFESNTSVFYYLSDNTIIWRPSGNIWSPINLRVVSSYGLTQQMQFAFKLKAIRLLLESSYTLNKTEVAATQDPKDMSLGKEIPYSPRHRTFTSFSFSHKRYGFLMQHQFTSARYSTFDASAQLNAYQVFDAGFRYTVNRNHISSNFNLMINNVFNVAYQTIAWQPMPGRYLSFQMQLSLF